MKTIIQTVTGDLVKSIAFYQTLNFKQVSQKSPCLFSDGKVLLEISNETYARAGIKLYKASWQNELLSLRKVTYVSQKDNQYVLADSSGMRIYLIEEEAATFDISSIESSYLGNNAGLSLESTDLEASLKIYEILGFKVKSGSAEQGWLALENEEKFSISLMKPYSCPHLFFNPSLTFFNGKEKNPKVIQKIRDLNISITEEITAFNTEGIAENVIIRDPGGFGFFVFND